MSRNLSECVGHGRVAEVYSWDESHVVKLFRREASRQAVEAEQRNMAVACGLGLPVPAPGAIVAVDGRIGLLMEAVAGESMMARIMREPERLEAFARALADLHTTVNRVRAPLELPALAESLAWRIQRAPRLSDVEREGILSLLGEMPSGEALCHGDFHPGNVLMCGDDMVIIDWACANRGPAMADAARTSLLFSGHIALQEASPEAQAPRKLFHDTYLECRLAASDADCEEFARWRPILAAARLVEGIDEQAGWLLQEVRRGLAR